MFLDRGSRDGGLLVSHYYALPSTHQSVGTFSLTYSYLSDTRFGAIGSRP